MASVKTGGAVVLSMALAAMSCGGGGGGGSSGDSETSSSVAFAGFSFRIGDTVTTTPPLEDLMAAPPTLGAPLNVVVVFQFEGVPRPPFTQQTLPIFTTPSTVSASVGAPSGVAAIPAKGEYRLVGQTVEFHPFVPTQPLQVSLSASPGAVPGLLPGSVYTARVSAGAVRIPNLLGSGGEIQFGTTSSEAAYYPAVAGDAPARVVASSPSDGAGDFFPAVFASAPLGQAQPQFPAGPEDFRLTYDRALIPTRFNLEGRDLDADGVAEPTFFLRARATKLLVGHVVPAGTLGAPVDVPAISAAAADATTLAADGSDIIVRGDVDLIASSDAGLGGVPIALAPGRDPSLLFVLVGDDRGPERLTVVDRVLGDPGHARIARNEDGTPQAWDLGLEDVVGLTRLVDGRLVVYDRVARRIVELVPAVSWYRPTPDEPATAAPQLTGLVIGDGVTGFRSGELAHADLEDVLDLAQAPCGSLYALVRLAGDSWPSIVRLVPVDPDGNGLFDEQDGTWDGDLSEALRLWGDYASIVFDGPRSVLALDRGADAVDRIDLDSGNVATVLVDVAAAGRPLQTFPDGRSPARALGLGHMHLDVDVGLESNTDAGAVVHLEPVGVLPIDAELTLMERNTLLSLRGASRVSTGVEGMTSVWGAKELLTVTTSRPVGGSDIVIDDAFIEDFDDASRRGEIPLGVSIPAEWALPGPGADSSGALRASTGVSDSALLGDFHPVLDTPFDPHLARVRSPPMCECFGINAHQRPEPDLDLGRAGYKLVFLDTDSQDFPLVDGSTPGVSTPLTVRGGHFVFRDFIVPEGVHVQAKGTRPLVITATRSVRIDGVIDVSGTDGLTDDSFDTGFVAVPGGPGGPGAGRGGDGHPSLSEPGVEGGGTINQLVTPETGENGFAPVVDASGRIGFQPTGGRGGISTLGFTPMNGFPSLPRRTVNAPIGSSNDEHHRPPGGGGGSFYTRGDASHEGAGVYRVQSHSTWAPFSKCPLDDKVRFAIYGNEEHRLQGLKPDGPLQCVYMEGTPTEPIRLKPGAAPGDAVFVDGDPSNDYVGEQGELTSLIGGQGGGGGGSRVDSMVHRTWALNRLGAPDSPSPPFYSKLHGPPYYSPTRHDAKGGAGGGGGGSVLIRSFGDIVIGRTAHIDASGGRGGGSEVVGNSSFSGGGGGGSGGAILLQAAGDITILADPGHRSASFIDQVTGFQGASLEVSGGFGRDARTSPLANATNLKNFTFDVTRSDGGQGGFGLIQLQEGGGESMPEVQQGAFLFAKKRAELKLGGWTGDDAGLQAEHPLFATQPVPDSLRYIDMLHYRSFRVGVDEPLDHYYVLNGSHPPMIPGDATTGAVPNESPTGSATFWSDTRMLEYPPGSGTFVVEEPERHKVMKTYNSPIGGMEVNNAESHPFPGAPGTTWRDDPPIPFSIDLVEPDGTPPMVDVAGEPRFDPVNLVDRLPVVHPSRTPPPFGSVSHGISVWLDFNGAALRPRDASGRTPPFFEWTHGTFNESWSALSPSHHIPAGLHGAVRVGDSLLPGGISPAFAVAQAGVVDPGLFGNGVPADPPFNDIKVDAPESGVENAIAANATVSLLFQGAYPIRPGSRVPDPDTITEWLADPSALAGHPLVRFQVRFDLEGGPSELPFGPGSPRPSVDEVRLRAKY